MVRAAGRTGGTVAVRRIRAMVAVSLGGTWGGEKHEHGAGKDSAFLSAASCNTWEPWTLAHSIPGGSVAFLVRFDCP